MIGYKHGRFSLRDPGWRASRGFPHSSKARLGPENPEFHDSKSNTG
jgi:hypothetical protein